MVPLPYSLFRKTMMRITDTVPGRFRIYSYILDFRGHRIFSLYENKMVD